MPKVGGKKFSYTKKGKAAAKTATIEEIAKPVPTVPTAPSQNRSRS